MLFSKRLNSIKSTIYISIDGASIGVALYNGNTCSYSDRRIHIEGETIKPIEVLLRDSLYALKHQNLKPIESIIVILESPWVKEKSIIIKEKRLKPFQISRKLIDELIKKDLQSKEEISSNIPLSYTIENIKLNGYIYDEPMGKITDEVEIIFTKFFGDKDIINIVDNSIKMFWNKTYIKYVSGAEFIFRIGKDLGATNDLYISLGSTDTILRTYSQGMISEKITLPFGFQNIIKSLSIAWSSNSKEVTHWLDLFLQKSLNPEESKRIEKDILEAAKDLIKAFEDASQKSANISLERPIALISGNETWSKLMSYMLKEKYFGSIFPYIENVPIQNLCQRVPNVVGDQLIALCACIDEVIK